MPYRWNKSDENQHPPSCYHLIIYYSHAALIYDYDFLHVGFQIMVCD